MNFNAEFFFRFSHSLSAQQKMTIHRKYDSVHINCIKYFIDDGDTTNDVMMAIVERLVSYLYILAAHWLFIVSMAHFEMHLHSINAYFNFIHWIDACISEWNMKSVSWFIESDTETHKYTRSTHLHTHRERETHLSSFNKVNSNHWPIWCLA